MLNKLHLLILLPVFLSFSNQLPVLEIAFPALSMNEDDSLLLDCSDHFIDSDGVIINCAPAIQNSFTISKINDFNYRLIPDHNFYGNVTVTVTAQDDSGGSKAASFYLTVINVNDPPVFTGQIKDTSIHCNGDLAIPLASVLTDVDDPIRKITISATVLNNLPYYRQNDTLIFQPTGYIDTARIVIRAVDSGGLFDTTTFMLYANKPVAFDSTFTIRCAPPSGSYFYPYNAWIESATDSTLSMFGCMDNRLFYDTYSIDGRKRRPTPFLSLPDCNYSDGDLPEVTKLSDNRFLLIYQFGISIESWRHVLLDSNLVEINRYQASVYDNPGHTVVASAGNIYVFGRHSPTTSQCLFVDVFDTNLIYLRSDTVSKNVSWAYSRHIFTETDGYIVFWTDRVPVNQFDRQLFAESFTADGRVAIPAKAILPYIQRDTAYPINYSPSVSVIRKKSGGFLVFWGMDDAVSQSGGSFGVFYRPQVYAIEVDPTLTVASNYATIVPDSTAFRRSTVTYAHDWGDKLLVVWKNSGGNGDWTSINYRAFNSNLQPISSAYTDGLRPDAWRTFEYEVINDSIIFRLDRTDNASLNASFRKNLIPFNQTSVFQNILRTNTPGIRPSYTSQEIPVYLYDLLGRRRSVKYIEGTVGNLPQGVVLMRSGSGQQKSLKKIFIQHH